MVALASRFGRAIARPSIEGTLRSSGRWLATKFGRAIARPSIEGRRQAYSIAHYMTDVWPGNCSALH